MFRHFSQKSNFNNLNSSLKSKLSNNFNNNFNNFSNKNNSFKNFFSKFSRKNFNNQPNPLSNLLPFTRAMVIGNIVMYGLSFFFSKRDYTTNFLYNITSLQNGRLLAPFTAHFSKDNTLTFAIDTLITGLIGNNIESILGTQVMQKMMLFSAAGAIILTHICCRQDEFVRPETVLRFVIYFLCVQNPHSKMFLFPLPFTVKIWWIGAFFGLTDFFQNKWYNFSPLIVCLMLKQKGGF